MQEGAGDPQLYDYAPYRGRKKVVWPGGKTVAVWVAPNLEYYEIDPPPHPKRAAWPRPHPDVVGFSHRDHSNRVSHWRMAEVMSKHGFPGSVSLSVALCGFALVAASGLLMFATQPAELLSNRAFTLKMLLLMLAGCNAAWFHGRGSLTRLDGLARAQMLASTVVWLAVVVCGRWIAYL